MKIKNSNKSMIIRSNILKMLKLKMQDYKNKYKNINSMKENLKELMMKKFQN